MKPRPRCILFDLDGTLVDSYEAIAESLNAVRTAFGRPPYAREEVVRMVGHGLENLIEQAIGAAHVAEGVRIFRERYKDLAVPGSRLLPGVAATVRELRARGYRMAVISNKPSRFSRLILDNLGVGELFSVLYGPDRAPAKPDPEMALRALSDLDCRPEESVLVGDMSVDLETASGAGLPFVAVATGSESRAALLAAGAGRILDRFEDLLDLFPPLVDDSAPVRS
jgi:phosphoglycolate phosphatase